MGNKVCVCVPIKIKSSKRKVIRTRNLSSPNNNTVPDLNLENYINSNTNTIPLPIKGIPFYNCQICCESKPLNDSFNVEGCAHFFCTQCTIKYIVSKLQDQSIANIVCPEPDCSVVLNPIHCKQILPKNVLDWWEKALSESAIPDKEKFFCPFYDCSALLLNDDEEAIVECGCPHCKRRICVQCKAPWHSEISCRKFQSMKDRNDDLMLDLAKRKNWRRCPKCKHYIEKTDGCNEMKCRCSYRFCYICGGTTNPLKQSCDH